MLNRLTIPNRRKELTAYSLFIVCALINSAYAQYDSQENSRLMMMGRYLTQQSVDHMESLLLKDTDNASLRIQLYEFYLKHSFQSEVNTTKYYDHLKWLVKYHPESSLFDLSIKESHIWTFSDTDDYREVKKLWQEHIRLQPDNIKIIINISRYYNLENPYSTEVLNKARTRFPENIELLKEIGHIYSMKARFFQGTESRIDARKSLDAYEDVFKLSSKSSFLKQYADDMAIMSVLCRDTNKAKFYADIMLSLAVELSVNDSYGAFVHVGNIIHGQIAIMENDIGLAEKHLIKAGKTPGSWTLSRHGPDTSLANKLLTIGKKETVLIYLKLCKKFCKGKQNDIDKWVESINNGRHPDWTYNFYEKFMNLL